MSEEKVNQEVKKLSEDNENLRKGLEALNMQYKQLQAAHTALDQGYSFFSRDCQQLRTALILALQDKADLEKSQKELLGNLDVQKTENKNLKEELNKLKDSLKPVSIPDNVQEEKAA
jgi:chromosome segregation ATPase